MRSILPLALSTAAVASAPAYASTVGAYVTSVTMANSSYTDDYACILNLSTSSPTGVGSSYYVDDVTNRFDATCSMAMLSMYFDDPLTVAYTTSGSTNWVTGLNNTRSTSKVTNMRTGSFTGSTYPHHCQGQITTSSGTTWINVDDDNPEEHVTCAALAMLHFASGTSATYSVTTEISGEIDLLQVAF